MGNSRITDDMFKESQNAIVQSVLDVLEKDDGKTFDEKRKQILAMLNTRIDEMPADILADAVLSVSSEQKVQEEFWKHGDIVFQQDDLILRKVNEADRDDYLTLKHEYAVMQSIYKDEIFRDRVWKDHIADKCLMFTIRKTDVYVGYCGINDLTDKPWEIVIELLPQWTRHGIGSRAIAAMLDEIRFRLGETEYKVRIDPTNYASQKMFEKLGAVPNGISEFLFHDEETIKQYEDKNLHKVDECLIQVAKKFSVEPRSLLSHVLEYTLTWNR